MLSLVPCAIVKYLIKLSQKLDPEFVLLCENGYVFIILLELEC
jgi:hypothetical protein